MATLRAAREAARASDPLGQRMQKLVALRRLCTTKPIRGYGPCAHPAIDTIGAVELLRWYGVELIDADRSWTTRHLNFIVDGGRAAKASGTIIQMLNATGIMPVGVAEIALDEHQVRGSGRKKLSASRLVGALLGLTTLEGDLKPEKEVSLHESEISRLRELIEYLIEDDTTGYDGRGVSLEGAQNRARFLLGRMSTQVGRSVYEANTEHFEWARIPLEAYIAVCAKGGYDPRRNRADLLKVAFDLWKRNHLSDEGRPMFCERTLAVMSTYVDKHLNRLEKAQALAASAPESKEAQEAAQKALLHPFEFAAVIGYVAEYNDDSFAVKWAQDAISAVYKQQKMRTLAKYLVHQEETGVRTARVKGIRIGSYKQPAKGPVNYEISNVARYPHSRDGLGVAIYVEQSPPEKVGGGRRARVMFFGDLPKALVHHVIMAVGRAELAAAKDSGEYSDDQFASEGDLPGAADRWFHYPLPEQEEGVFRGAWLLNGSTKHPDIEPTRLTMGELMRAVKKGIEAFYAASEIEERDDVA